MPRFDITINAVYPELYCVEADNEEQALQRLLSDDPEEFKAYCTYIDSYDWEKFVDVEDALIEGEE